MIRRVFRSAGVRLAFAYAALFGFSATALILVLWSATVSLLNGQVDAAIQTDGVGLVERWHEGGLVALLATIDERLAGNVDDDAVYLVVDGTGHIVTGNLDTWPPEVTETGPIYEAHVHRHGESLARLRRFALPDRFALLIGRDVQPRAALRDLLARTLGWALLLILAMSAAGALVVKLLFRRMLSQVSVTAAAISAGDLSRRVQVSGRGDEFDRLADTINTMLDRIGRLMDGVRQVSNAIAHDLRTPITRARARLEDAAEHAPTTEALRAEVRHALDDLDGITAVFQALLRISEIEAGARRSAFTRLDLAPLLQDLSELYSAVAEERGLQLVPILHGLLPFRGDRDLIQQAVANLLDNALKFSSPGGTVHLTGERAGTIICLSVLDAGPGMPQTDMSRATERFFRGETARGTPGFGLGLTLVRAVAQLHGGSITLVNTNPGLRASLTLPLVETPEELPRRAALPPERDYQDVTVRGLGRV